MDYYQKYQKYKEKYMLLKQSLNNNSNLEGGSPIITKILDMKPPGYYATKIMVGDNRLDIVPPEKRTENLCSMAVNRNSWDLEHVPDDCKTYEICLNAVQNTGRMLKYVLDKHKDYNMCHKAIVLSNKKDSITIKYVDKSMISEEDYNFLVKEAVSNDGDALEHVPKEKKTFVLCDIAVKSRKRAIRYVPLEFYKELWNKYEITEKDFGIPFTSSGHTYINNSLQQTPTKKTYYHKR